MIVRIIILLLIAAVFYFITVKFLAVIAGRKCEACDGNGYWVGTRGEKNHCGICDGSGKK